MNGMKQAAVQSVLVEIVGFDIRGRDNDHAVFEQLGEETPEDHRIRDVGDMEFVEAQKPRVLRDRGRGEQHRVLAVAFAAFHSRAEEMHALMHLRHEFMKMHAAFARHHARFKKQIHQHGLAATDAAMKIKPLHRRLRLAARKHPAERRRFAREMMRRELVFDVGEFCDRGFLCRIAFDPAGGGEGGVMRADGAGH